MSEYRAWLLPVLLAVASVTPASATIYTQAIDRPAVVDGVHSATDATQTAVTGPTYDNLTGKFAVQSASSVADCGTIDCAATPADAAPAAQPIVRPAASDAASRAGHPADGATPSTASPTAANAASNWYTTTLISDAYTYNGNNNAFLVDDTASFLPTMPDFNSWALMFAGMAVVIFLMRRVGAPTRSEPDAVEQAWGGPTTRAMELRGAPVAVSAKAKALAAAPALCCSRQALPGS